MSFDNVISVAAAAKGSVGLLALGIAISIPLMVIGAQMMLWLLDRFPWLMVAGSGLLGWIAGELAISDRIVADALGHPGPLVHYGVAAATRAPGDGRRLVARAPAGRVGARHVFVGGLT